MRAGLFGSASDSDSAIDEFEFEMIRLLCCSKQEQVLQQDARIKVEMIASMVLYHKRFNSTCSIQNALADISSRTLCLQKI